MTWFEVNPVFELHGLPCPRLDHGACLTIKPVVEPNMSLDNQDMMEVNLIEQGASVSSLQMLQDAIKQSSMIIFGGMNFSNVFNDVYELLLK